MADSSEEFWSVVDEFGNEVSLNQYAWAITTYGGSPRAFPDLRGEEPVYAFRAGSEFRPKEAEARTISFTMFVNGSDPTLEVPPEDEDAQFTANWLALQKLFWTPSKQITLRRRWKASIGDGEYMIKSADARAQIAGAMEPEMTSRSRATFTVDLLLSDPYFYGEPKTVELSKDPEAPTTIYNDGSAPSTGVGCTLTFPLTDIEYDHDSNISWEQWVTEFSGGNQSFLARAVQGGGNSTVILEEGAGANALVGWKIKIVSGPAAGEVKRIKSNTFSTTATTVTIDGSFSTAVTTNSTYQIYPGAVALWPLNETSAPALQSIAQRPGYLENQSLSVYSVQGGGSSTLSFGVADAPTTAGGKVVQFKPTNSTTGRILRLVSPDVDPGFFKAQVNENSFYGHSFSILMKCSTFGAQSIFYLGNTFLGGAQGYVSLELLSTGQAVATYHNSFSPSTAIKQVVSPNSVVDGKWHQLGVSTAVGGWFGLFVDGQLVSAIAPSDLTGGSLGVCDIYLGGRPGADANAPGSKMFTGKLSNFAIYDHQLSFETSEGAYQAILGHNKGLYVQNDYKILVDDDLVSAPDIHSSHWVKMQAALSSTGDDTVTMYMDTSVASIKNRLISDFAPSPENNYFQLINPWEDLPEPYTPVHFGSKDSTGLIRNISEKDLEYDKTYYVELVDPVSRKFTLSSSIGGPRVQFKRWWSDAGARIFAGEFPITGAVSSYGAQQWITLYPGYNSIKLTDAQGNALTGDGKFYLTFREPYV